MTAPTDAPAAPEVSILLVDDDPANLLALEVTLEGPGRRLVRAFSGEQALRLLLAEDFAVVLLDLRLPGLDGFQTARQIRGQERSRHTPIIFLTGYDGPDFPLAEAYKLGAVDYLVKPLVAEILCAKVAVFVELYQNARRLQRQAEELHRAEHGRAEHAALIQYAVAGALAESADLHAALPAVLRVAAEGLGWDAAGVWAVDREAGVLRCTGFWHSPDAPVGAFEAVSRTRAMRSGEGLPGRVWAGGQPAWIEDIAGDGNFPRLRPAQEAGLHGACALPIRLGREGVGVLEFFSRQPRPRDDGMLRALAALGSQIGQFLERRRAEELLRLSEARKAAVLEVALDAVITIDREGKVVEWNPAAERIFGYRRAEALGAELAALIVPPRLREAHRLGLARFLATGEGPVLGRRIEMPAVRAGGEEFPAELAVTAHDGGGPTLFTAHVRDITERKRAEDLLRASEERFAGFMRHLPGLAWIKDSEGRYVYANDDAERAFRTPRERLYGRTDEEVFPPQTAAQFRENDRLALGGGGAVQGVETLEQEDGVHHSLVSKFVIPAREGESALIGGVAIDITDRLRAEEALREAGRRKDAFLAMLAHELRNPLATLTPALQTLRQGGSDAQVRGRVLERMERQLGHLRRLVDDLLEASQLVHGKAQLNRDRVDLARLVRSAAEDRRAVLEGAGLALEVSAPQTPLWVRGDSVRLSQVVGNLLDNAARYSERGGRVRVAVESIDGRAALAVSDQGVGIAADVLPRLFQPFEQADQGLARQRGGLGLGLSVVKGLVELHGGQVEAASDGPGRGATFTVRLPLEGEPGALTGLPAQATASATGARVLIVEDNPDAVESLRVLLGLLGHEVRVAGTGPDGVREAAAWLPEVVMCDIGLPGFDGWEVARRVRALPAMRGALLVALTGYGADEDKGRSREAGFDLHLVKPADPAELRRALDARVA